MNPVEAYNDMVRRVIEQNARQQEVREEDPNKGFWGKAWDNFKENLPATMAGVGAALAHPSMYNGGALGSMGVGLKTQADFRMMLEEMKRRDRQLQYQQQQQTMRNLVSGPAAVQAMKEGSSYERRNQLADSLALHPWYSQYSEAIRAGVPLDKLPKPPTELDEARTDWYKRRKDSTGPDPEIDKRDFEAKIMKDVMGHMWKTWVKTTGYSQLPLDENGRPIDPSNMTTEQALAMMAQAGGQSLGDYHKFIQSPEGRKQMAYLVNLFSAGRMGMTGELGDGPHGEPGGRDPQGTSEMSVDDIVGEATQGNPMFSPTQPRVEGTPTPRPTHTPGPGAPATMTPARVVTPPQMTVREIEEMAGVR